MTFPLVTMTFRVGLPDDSTLSEDEVGELRDALHDVGVVVIASDLEDLDFAGAEALSALRRRIDLPALDVVAEVVDP